MSQIFDLNYRVSPDYMCVENAFMQQLINLATQSAQNLKILAIVQKNLMSNRGEVQQKGIAASDKSVLDICKLTPLEPNNAIQGNIPRTLLEEVALTRFLQIPSINVTTPIAFAKANDMTLFLDYMLSASLCYVECFDGTTKIDKFFATRNRFIAGLSANVGEEETSKYSSYLSTSFEDYSAGMLKILKLTRGKDGLRITKPRSSLNVKVGVKVTPVFFMNAFVKAIQPILANNIIQFKYIKDNIQEREMYTTMSQQILMHYYKDINVVHKMLGGTDMSYYRGYVKLPEIGISRYDETGVRALNITRITEINKVSAVDASFIDVDFNSIMPSFIEGVNLATKDPQVLSMIYTSMMNQNPPNISPVEVANLLITWVNTQHAIGTTTFLRYLHNFMLANAVYFRGYNGRPRTFGTQPQSFNMGVVKDDEEQFIF